MIVMINGAFGAGKTTVATKLLERMDHALLYDPEEVGYMLREMIPNEVKLPVEQTGDFQDFLMWKTLVVEVAKQLKQTYDRDLIVPMTIYKKDYFNTIYEGFSELDEETFHFCLTAEKQTIHNRLLTRGEEPGNWCFAQTDKCLEGYQDSCFEQFIQTDNRDVEQIVDLICEEIGFIPKGDGVYVGIE
ncbi:tunicamycin resistance protein [Sporosarcina sp. NCCP-2222]|uniref:AAA family ATPase n=1 Tax=Sporosarcina sp. NCCP-2222 TaxID=2935073 RepID=UPI002088E8DA|nr:AAA family ATPase [Sporosarcina sp. NCCP-2222]GKV54963.1 tunicamycin resistance protein [Sporosarcina sp. NCCP-2222]